MKKEIIKVKLMKSEHYRLLLIHFLPSDCNV